MQKLTPAQEEWLQALESGKYKQGTMRLKRLDENGNPSYCCLGVACELYLEKFPKSFKTQTIDDIPEIGISVKFDNEKVALPDDVLEHLNLRQVMGETLPYILKSSLWRMNDGAGTERKDFCTIAKIIRENPERYFTTPPSESEEQSLEEPSESSQCLPSPQS